MMRWIQAAANLALWKQATLILASLAIINRVPMLRQLKTS